MMKNNQKYWEDRIILKDKLLEKDIKKIEKNLLKLFYLPSTSDFLYYSSLVAPTKL